MLNCDAVSDNGGDPSRDSVLASLPLVCSKKTPYPPRMAILPSPLGSQAKPMRGAGLNKCPFKQPASEDGPTLAAGNAASVGFGIAEVPPGPPHWMIPLNGFPVPAIKDPSVALPLVSIVGELAALKALCSKL